MYRRFIITAVSAFIIPLGVSAQDQQIATERSLAGGSGYEHAALLARRGELAVVLQALRPLARGGHAEAALLLGRMHAEGRGVPASHQQGLTELRKTALVAEPDALAFIGFRFLFEDAFPGYDPAEAHRWFTAAAHRGSAQGAFGLGLLYRHGRGVPQSDSTAAAWFAQAAERGFVPAELMLATLRDDPSSQVFDPNAAERTFAALQRGGHSGLLWAWADAYTGGAREWYPVPVDHHAARRLRDRALRISSGGGGAPLSGQAEEGRQP